VLIALVLGGLAGCQAAAEEPPPQVAPPTAPATAPPSTPATPSTPVLSPSPTGTPQATATPRTLSKGWRITTYYTPVQSFHTGATTKVRGCPRSRCANPTTDLGTYPETFVKAVKTEGHGRITSGPQAGRYLAWSRRVGHFWLDDVARDAVNQPLRPWVTAAADQTVLKRGAAFVITDCGRGTQEAVCNRFRAARWTVVDVFAPGFGGKLHADIYIGEETGPDFRQYYTTLNDAVLGLF
jgi:hypothetical protein